MPRLIPKETYLIIPEGPTEHSFIKWLINNNYLDRQHISLQPRLPKHSDYRFIFTQAESALKKSPWLKVFAIIDLDTVKSNRKYFEQKQKLQKKFPERFFTFESNPCFEFFLLLIHKNTSKPFSDCSQAINELKKFWPKYQKGQNITKTLDKNFSFYQLNSLILNSITAHTTNFQSSFSQLHTLLITLSPNYDSREELVSEISNKINLKKQQTVHIAYLSNGELYKFAFFTTRPHANILKKLKKQLPQTLVKNYNVYTISVP